jgi:ABC-2 type transport system permease protein
VSADTIIARTGSGTGTGHSSFRRLLLAEWTKLRTVRSTVLSLIILVVVALGLTGLLTWLTVATWNSGKGNDSGHVTLLADPVSSITGDSAGLAQLAVIVLGVLVASSEYSTGMISSTLLATPHRLRMLAAKCIVFALVVLVVGEVVAFPSFFIGAAILHTHVQVAIGDPGVTRAVAGEGLYLAMLGVFSLAIGQLLRHTAGAITGVIAFVLVISPLANLLPDSWGKHVYNYLPTVAGTYIGSAHQQSDQLLSPWQGYGVFALWTALLVALAAWSLVKRDA